MTERAELVALVDLPTARETGQPGPGAPSRGRRWQTWLSPDIARRVQAGQYLHVLAPSPRGLLLPAISVAGYDRVAGTVNLLVDEGFGRSALWDRRQGDEALFDGPLGRGFRVDARSRHLLVICDGDGMAGVRALLDEAVASARQVTLLLGAPSAAAVFPSTLLPDEVEYVVATEDGSLGHAGTVTDLLLRYEAWADQCFAAGPWPLLEALARFAGGRDARLGVARLGPRRGRRAASSAIVTRRRAWLQVMLPHPAGCALGVCLGCVVDGADGPVRVCREGPAFGSAELTWEGQR